MAKVRGEEMIGERSEALSELLVGLAGEHADDNTPIREGESVTQTLVVPCVSWCCNRDEIL